MPGFTPNPRRISPCRSHGRPATRRNPGFLGFLDDGVGAWIGVNHFALRIDDHGSWRERGRMGQRVMGTTGSPSSDSAARAGNYEQSRGDRSECEPTAVGSG